MVLHNTGTETEAPATSVPVGDTLFRPEHAGTFYCAAFLVGEKCLVL